MEHEKNASFMKKMFVGVLQEEDLFPYPEVSQENKELGREMTSAIQAFAKDQIDSPQLDIDHKIPREILSALAEMGLCGLAVPQEYSGLGLDYTMYARVFVDIVMMDPSIGVTLGAHQSIGYRALINEGSPAQKEKYMHALAKGEKFAAFCLTEPGSGSDAFSIKTMATQIDDNTFEISGQKIWITNGGMADFYTVFAKTKLLKDDPKVKKDSITCFIVEKTMPGISFGEPEKKMGIRASETRAVYFDKVKVSKEHIIGEIGNGFKICLNVLNSGRLSLGAGSVGGIRQMLVLATEHAKTRVQFGKPIKDFGLIQEKLATLEANCFACESLVFFVTGKIGQGMKDYAIESAAIKVFCSEALWESVDIAMQIAAGNGYMCEYPYERMMRDARINLIFEGTNEILRCLIALTGFKSNSDKLEELGQITDLSKALADPKKTFSIISEFALKRIQSVIPLKSFSNLEGELFDIGKKLSQMLSEFTVLVEDLLIKHKKRIIENEFMQKRVAEMAIHLLVMCSSLSRCQHLISNPKLSEADKKHIIELTTLVCRRSRFHSIAVSKSISTHKDEYTKSVSDYICEKGHYPFDILD